MRASRLQELEKYIFDKNHATIPELCEEFGVSVNTIRRDLKALLERGSVKTVYGGVESLRSDPLVPFSDRRAYRLEEKKRIVQKAAEFVSDGDIIYLDSGSTTALMIDYIHSRKDVTVITNNLSAVQKAQPYLGLNVVVLPGVLTHRTYSTTGPETIQTLERYNIQKAFMAATGASIQAGYTNSTPAEHHIKQTVLQRSVDCFMLMDASKLGRTSLLTFAPLDGIRHLICDQLPQEPFLGYFKTHAIDVILP